ncbi:MAG: hypothetical protein K8R23_20300 [Chthoniobacter sp.]|nr:hypothetical protein [Chthoniobacter sp.]
MRNIFTALLIAVGASVHLGFAGETAPARTHFRQSATYPFVFRADSYLASGAPSPLRFAPALPHCPERNAPALTPAAKGVEVLGPDAALKNETPPKTEDSAPADKVTHSAPAPLSPHDEIDFGRLPNEVLDFFKNTEGRPVRRSYLFDPIFQPATPNELPKSKATSQQK